MFEEESCLLACRVLAEEFRRRHIELDSDPDVSIIQVIPARFGRNTMRTKFVSCCCRVWLGYYTHAGPVMLNDSGGVIDRESAAGRSVGRSVGVRYRYRKIGSVPWEPFRWYRYQDVHQKGSLMLPQRLDSGSRINKLLKFYFNSAFLFCIVRKQRHK